MRTFGCIAHVKVTRPHAAKLDDRSMKMVFLGYEPGSKGYRVYDPVSGRLHVSRDVVFDETKGWNWEAPDDVATPDTFTVEYVVRAATASGQSEAPATLCAPATPAASPGTPSVAEEPHTPVGGGIDIGFATPPMHIPSGMDLSDEGGGHAVTAW